MADPQVARVLPASCAGFQGGLSRVSRFANFHADLAEPAAAPAEPKADAEHCEMAYCSPACSDDRLANCSPACSDASFQGVRCCSQHPAAAHCCSLRQVGGRYCFQDVRYCFPLLPGAGNLLPDGVRYCFPCPAAVHCCFLHQALLRCCFRAHLAAAHRRYRDCSRVLGVLRCFPAQVVRRYQFRALRLALLAAVVEPALAARHAQFSPAAVLDAKTLPPAALADFEPSADAWLPLAGSKPGPEGPCEPCGRLQPRFDAVAGYYERHHVSLVPVRFGAGPHA